MKIKRHYTAPVTLRAAVELEGGFCGSIMESTGSIKAEGHETGDTYIFEEDGIGGSVNGSSTNDGFSITWN